MNIFGITLHNLKYKTFLSHLLKLDTQNIVFTPNPEICLKILSDKTFKDLLNKANYLTPDGIGLYLAFQILDEKNIFLKYIKLPYFLFTLFFQRTSLYKKYGDRICGSDLTKDILEYSNKNNISLSIIDLYNPTDTAKVASQQAFGEKLQSVYPKLKFDYFIYNPEKKSEIIQSISNSKSQIVFSTLGMKQQEESVIEIMNSCKNIKLGLGIGSSFDYFIGFQKRAPKTWRSLGLEWLYRLLTGPRKIDRMKRIYNAIFVFTYKVLTYKNIK